MFLSHFMCFVWICVSVVRVASPALADFCKVAWTDVGRRRRRRQLDLCEWLALRGGFVVRPVAALAAEDEEDEEAEIPFDQCIARECI